MLLAYDRRMRIESRVAAFGALAGGMIAISWSAIFVRWTRMPGASSAFYRMAIAALVLWPLVLLLGKSARGLSARTLWTVVAGGVFFAGDVGFWNVAVMHTSAANATFLSNCSPLFLGLILWIVTRRLPPGRFWIALVLGLTGTGLIVFGDLRHSVVQAPEHAGADGFAVIAAICFALYLVITSRLREHCETAVLLAVSTTASAATLLIFALAAHISLAVPGVGPLWALLAMALVCQVGGYFGLTYALGHLPATVTSILWLAVAPMTAVFAWIIFGERMRPVEILGGALLLVGVWIVGRKEKDPQEMPEPELVPPVAQV